jgi:glutathionylspermidine synthase
VIATRAVTPLDTAYLEKLGFTWHTDPDHTPYVADTLVELTEAQAQAYYDAANELYDMFIAAAQHVIDHDRFHEIGIPFNLVELIKASWEEDIHWHLYGRFDLAGGINGAPIKLLEFNADTPTALFETAIVQWALMQRNGLDEAQQFNNLYEALVENFKRLVTLEESTEMFDDLYEGWKFLFSSVRDNDEEEYTVRLLQHLANEAGFETEFAYVDEVEFDGDEGVFYQDEPYELWFKLLPWEDIAISEGELATLLTQIVRHHKAILFNPAYTLLFQSKGLLPILWELYPDHPLLLESSFEPLEGQKQVQKPIYGREGGSVRILEADGSVIAQGSDEYDAHAMIHQAYTDLPIDAEGRRYQAGVFYAYEACGVGCRRGDLILDNGSKFVGHIVN